MQEAINGGRVSERSCRRCSKSIVDQVEYGPHIFIDTSVLTDDRYNVRGKIREHTLDSVANSIVISDDLYTLAGLVHYMSDHYVAYAKSGLYWYEYNDQSSSPSGADRIKKALVQ